MEKTAIHASRTSFQTTVTAPTLAITSWPLLFSGLWLLIGVDNPNLEPIRIHYQFPAETPRTLGGRSSLLSHGPPFEKCYCRLGQNSNPPPCPSHSWKRNAKVVLVYILSKARHGPSAVCGIQKMLAGCRKRVTVETYTVPSRVGVEWRELGIPWPAYCHHGNGTRKLALSFNTLHAHSILDCIANDNGMPSSPRHFPTESK